MSGPSCWLLVHGLDGGGVSAVLVRYLRWLRSPAGPPPGDAPEVHVIAGGGGRWADEVAALATSCTVLGPAQGRSAASTVAVAAAQLGWPGPGAAVRDGWVRGRVRGLPRPDVVLVHGAGAWPLWRSLAPAAGRCRLVLHLHELAVAVGRSVPDDELGALVAEPDVLAAVCSPEGALAELLGARAGELVVVPGCTDGADGDADDRGLGSGAPAVVAVGEGGWRKGADRFEALAHELARRGVDVAYRWIGDLPPAPWQLAVGSPSPVRWEGARPEPWRAVAPGSVVVLPAREDPLPLAALEAGRRGLPVVASGSGGLHDLLAEGRGWFVGAPDVRALADAVQAALADADEAGRRGAALRAHVAAELSPVAVGPRWLALLDGDRPASA